MEFKKFIKLICDHPSITISSLMIYDERIIDHRTLMEYKELTKYIDYGCVFKGKKCTASWITEKCCCDGCGKGIIGHHHGSIPKDLEVLETMAKNFRYSTGFWRKEEGCILPRKYRSVMCLVYSCTDPFPIKESRFLFDILKGYQNTTISPECLEKIMIKKLNKRKEKNEKDNS